MLLAAKSIDTLKLQAGKSDQTFWDDELTGFGLRVRDNGSRKFVFRYRVGSKQQFIVLGPASKDTLQAARKAAGEHAIAVKQGENPALKRDAAIADNALTFSSLVEKYLATKKADKAWSESWEKRTEQYLTEYAAHLHKLPIRSVTQDFCATAINAVATTRGKVSANRYRGALSSFFSWVLGEGIQLPEGHPVENTNKRKEVARERVLTHDELRQIWNACDTTETRGGTTGDYGAIVRLLMLTGQRRDEVGGLRWSEIDGGQINLPKERTKNGRPHIIPLSDTALEIINARPRKGRENVFGETGTTGFGGWSHAKTALDGRIGEIAPWTIHDLRRTAATIMADELGVQPHIIEAVLNHVSGHKSGVAGIYNRATYDKEKREALNLWAEHIMALVEGRKAVVVPMKRA